MPGILRPSPIFDTFGAVTSTEVSQPVVGLPGALGDDSAAERGDPHRGDIQGLRAIAVLLVILSHAGVTALAGGFVGVDVFFVLSGFLITGVLVRQAERDGSVSIKDFYANRAKRILPAALLVLIASLLAAQHILSYSRAMDEARSTIWATFFAANWHFGLEGIDYFAQDRPTSDIQHFWSLAVEEQFYLVWPLLILVTFLVMRMATGQLANGWQTKQIRRRVLFGLFAAITGASFAWSILETANNPEFAYFSTMTRAWELGAGGLLSVMGAKAGRLSPRRRRF